MTGTATVVEAESVVVFLNQVDVRASRAKFGNRFASIVSFAFSRSLTGNSSKSMYTTGVVDWTVAAAALMRAREDELLDVRVEEERREEDQRRAGEDREERTDERHPPRRERQRDADRDRADNEDETRVHAAPFQRLDAEDGCEQAQEHVMQDGRIRRVTSSTRSSMPSRISAGASVTTSAKKTMSPGVEPRTAKNSAFLPRMSKSGCASANPETASNCAPRTAGSRKR